MRRITRNSHELVYQYNVEVEPPSKGKDATYLRSVILLHADHNISWHDIVEDYYQVKKNLQYTLSSRKDKITLKTVRSENSELVVYLTIDGFEALVKKNQKDKDGPLEAFALMETAKQLVAMRTETMTNNFTWFLSRLDIKI